jgi:type VI secretion system secreted protein VgrG
MSRSAAHQFRLAIAPFFEGLRVLSFSGTEAISELFAFELEVLIDDPRLDASSLMYRSAFLGFQGTDVGVHGQIHSVMRSHYKPGPACYHLSIGPRLACLGQRYTPRVFQHLSAPKIIVQLLREHGIRPGEYQLDLKNEYRPRDVCAQYRETDLQLLQRLCAEEGIHFHFCHTVTGHVLVFGDGLRVFPRGQAAAMQGAAPEAGVRQFSLHPGDPERATDECQGGRGESTLPFIASGQLLPLLGHADQRLNRLWLVTRVTHRGLDRRQSKSAAEQAGLYVNEFNVAPWEAGFRAQAALSPAVGTLHRAFVVGAGTEPVSPDAQGRVKVQFDWGCAGRSGSWASCSLPIDPALDTPLPAGTPVMVSFAGGNEGRPVILARCWQAADMLPGAQLDTSDGTSDGTSYRQDRAGQVEARLSRALVMGSDPWIQIEGGVRLTHEPGRALCFSVGNSRVQIGVADISLSSPHIVLGAGASSLIEAPEP